MSSAKRSVKVLQATIAGLTAVAVIGIGAIVAIAAESAPGVSRVDYARTVTMTTPTFDARLAPASAAPIKEFRIPIKDATLEIATGIKYAGWTFGGTVPGPALRVRQGDLVKVTVVNETPMPHSIDFHAARIPANVAYRIIMPKDSVTFAFTARDAGAFMVHCGTPPVTMHLMQGMYLPIIVDPKDGWGTTADKEFILVQSEFYTQADPSDSAKRIADYAAAGLKQASYVVFNGRAFQYKDTPIKVAVGDRVRFFVVNAGPNFTSDFHVVGAIFTRVYPDGNPRHALENVQTYGIPAGGGAVFETVFSPDASGEGLYPFVTHAFADAEKGAVGIIQVGAPKQFATMSH
ncbi:MAG: multicopper oxidase domain-containing protein [Gemmatimonadota bacterium]|nr:multicopper oxidase domain-containing protein [Gemmatimonadota bacterium]